MQTAWLAFITSLLHLIVNDKSIKKFAKEPDPKTAGIQVDVPKKRNPPGKQTNNNNKKE